MDAQAPNAAGPGNALLHSDGDRTMNRLSLTLAASLFGATLAQAAPPRLVSSRIRSGSMTEDYTFRTYAREVLKQKASQPDEDRCRRHRFVG